MPQYVAAFGEIMLRLSPSDRQRVVQAHTFDATFGGAEANVAGALAGFGEPSRYITRLPNNDLGLACLMYLRAQGIDTSSVLLGGERMGVYFVEQGSAHRPGQVIYDRARSGFATLEPGMIDWGRALEGVDWFHWTGINPALSESVYRTTHEALEAVRARSLTISCDLNYRSKLWQWGAHPADIMPDLLAFCDVLMGSIWQLQRMFGFTPEQIASTAAALDALRRAFPRLRTIALTTRSDQGGWTGTLWHDGTMFAGREYQISDAVDPVGGGDAFSAGLIYGLRRLSDPQMALDFALAAGVFKHSVPGDSLLARVEEIMALLGDQPQGHMRR